MMPNTTQIPNILFNGEMQKMKDTELRICLIVARKTLGWIIDKKTGMRKEEDWISNSQLRKFTGRGSQAVCDAIEHCIKNGWIEARDIQGNILTDKNQRIGRKIFYRLGQTFLKIKKVSKKVFENQNFENQNIQKKLLTKQTSYKTANSCEFADEGDPINQIFNLFYEKINPQINYQNLTQRKAAQWLLDKYGLAKIKKTAEYAISAQGQKYAPVITAPLQLKNKLAELLVFYKRQKTNGFQMIDISE